LINKEDFDEGKNKDIVTARATPVKHNALANKNITTTSRKHQSMHSPNLSLQSSKQQYDINQRLDS